VTVLIVGTGATRTQTDRVDTIRMTTVPPLIDGGNRRDGTAISISDVHVVKDMPSRCSRSRR